MVDQHNIKQVIGPYCTACRKLLIAMLEGKLFMEQRVPSRPAPPDSTGGGVERFLHVPMFESEEVFCDDGTMAEDERIEDPI